MTVAQLGAASPTPKTKYYLDTSALFSLASLQAAADGQAVPALETKRASDVTAFLARARAVGGLVCTSVLAFQEIAHKARRRSREECAKIAGFASWQHLDSTGASANRVQVVEQAHDAMLKMLEWTAVALRAVHGEVEQPAVAADKLTERGLRFRKAHRRFLRLYKTLDSMDALHIVVGTDLGAKDFVSFDKGWEDVAEITVYR